MAQLNEPLVLSIVNKGVPTINTRIPKVLVIESDEKDCIMMTGALEGAGFMVTSARDGLEGLQKLVESYIDIIVMNSELPKVYGEDARIRICQASNIPIIVIGDNHNVAESLELGADAFIPRPPILRELVARVRSLLNRTPAFMDKNTHINLNISNITDYPFFLADERYLLGDEDGTKDI
jgi:DNA-binding response OmpR family regulator